MSPKGRKVSLLFKIGGASRLNGKIKKETGGAMEKFLVSMVEKVKKILHLKTWQVESIFVLSVLAMVAIVLQRGWIEWVGVLAVWFTWNHASVASRMEEQQALLERKKTAVEVHCYKWTTRYFYLKEVLWFVYFATIGAYSALVGVLVFLLYGWWRKTWRTYHPL